MRGIEIASAPTLAELYHQRTDILALASDYKARQVRIFGSVARGTAQPESDVDFLVVFDSNYTLFDQAGLLVALQELLGHTVDVVNEPFLREEYRPLIMKDVVWL